MALSDCSSSETRGQKAVKYKCTYWSIYEETKRLHGYERCEILHDLHPGEEFETISWQSRRRNLVFKEVVQNDDLILCVWYLPAFLFRLSYWHRKSMNIRSHPHNLLWYSGPDLLWVI